MRIISQLLLTFLLNSLWQIALIAALATFGAWLLRNSVVRYGASASSAARFLKSPKAPHVLTAAA